jgi:hypothetical protein
MVFETKENTTHMFSIKALQTIVFNEKKKRRNTPVHI